MSFKDTENFLKEFMSGWQTAKIYETTHPKFIKAIEQIHKTLSGILTKKEELIIGIFAEELASGDDIFFDLSKRAISSITYLKKMGIERITFNKGVSHDELIDFFSLLIMPKEKIEIDPQDYLANKGIKNIVISKIKTLAKDSNALDIESANKLKHYENCLDRLPQSLDMLINEDTVDHLNLKSITNNIMDNLTGNYQAFFKLIETKGHDVVTFTHLLNVSTLSMYFAQKLGFIREDCLNIGVAALFHDVGKLYIKRKIIQKAGRLDEEEFSKMRSHTVLGAELLIKHIDMITILPVVVAFEHHLGYDLKGYPRISFSGKPHIASLIVMICDVYDALMQRRSYKRDYPPEVIFQIMTKDRGKKLVPLLLDKFFKIMGVWPKGTIVLLEDGRVAIVREENEKDIFSPKIEIAYEASRGLIDLSRAEQIKIKHSLNPLAEGKKYLDLL